MIRSLQFIPGNSAAMLQNADIHGADAIILDLEDAVALKEKDSARALVSSAVRSMGFHNVTLVIRINPIDTVYWQDDLEAVVPLKPAYIMPTKVSGKEAVQTVSAYIAEVERKHGIETGTVQLMPLLETAMGIEKAFEIATADPRVKAMFLGAEDLTSDLGAIRSKQGDEILYARGRIVTAAKAAGILVFDTPFTDVNDLEGLEKDALFAKSLGFTGKASISPRHIECINAVFSPSQDEIAYASDVMKAIRQAEKEGKGAVSLRGKMIDKPIVMRAQRVLEAAKRLGLGGFDE